MSECVDYARIDYEYRAHHQRFKAYVERCGLPCQACRASGEVFEEMIAGYPRYEWCGWCEGTGKVTRHLRGLWLRSHRHGEATA